MSRQRGRLLPPNGGAGEDVLEHISWDEFFRKFDDAGLALVYQEEKAGGEGSTFFTFVRR